MNSSRQGSPFPSTRWSIIRDAADKDSPSCRSSLNELAQMYWRPVYAYVRRKWHREHEAAKDLTQEFFLSLFEKEFLGGLSPESGKFRSWIFASLNNFVVSHHRRENALKRGGGREQFQLKLEKGFEPAAEGSPEDVFHREWAEATVGAALEDLEKESPQECAIVKARDFGPSGDPSYKALADQFGMTVSEVRNRLFRARKRLRELILARVRDTVTSEKDAETEMRDLFTR